MSVWRCDPSSDVDLVRAIGGVADALTTAGLIGTSRGETQEFSRWMPVFQAFDVGSTSITPACALLLFVLAARRSPARIVVVGSHRGLSLAVLVAGALSVAGASQKLEAIGLDISTASNAVASKNVARWDLAAHCRYIAADGVRFLSSFIRPIDALLLDLDSEVSGKAAYAEAFRAAGPCLAQGALVMAHDALVPEFATDLARLAAAIRASHGYSPPLAIPIDSAGLLLSVRRECARGNASLNSKEVTGPCADQDI